MSLDTRFSGAVHMLIMVSESEKPVSSQDIARSMGTNASYVRKLASSLKKADLIRSTQGVVGYHLTRPAHTITFLDIALASMEIDSIHMFEIHKNLNDKCVVGRYIQPVLTEEFAGLDAAMQETLKNQTLQDCIDKMRQKIEKESQ